MAVDPYREGKTGQTGKVLDKTQERGYKDHHLGLMKRRSPHCEEKVVGAVKPLMFVEANKVLEEMFIKSYRPPADTYNMLSRGLCSMRRQCKGVTWLEEMVSQDISYLNFLCGTPG
ncbi:hypothetical protein NC651_032079 [Populus alba x Populus x berolinensis]|nr:hypothetical protein NC651_032079 [Populus alba x Populus x berolinensis]